MDKLASIIIFLVFSVTNVKLENLQTQLKSTLQTSNLVSSCINSACPSTNVNKNDCDALCSANVTKLENLLFSMGKCLQNQICGLDFNNVNLKNISIPILVEGYTGCCKLQSDNVKVTGLSASIYDYVFLIRDDLKIPYYNVDPIFNFTFFGLSVNCTTYDSSKYSSFFGNLNVSQIFLPRYNYNSYPNKTETNFGLTYSFSNVTLNNSLIPKQHSEQVKTAIQNVFNSYDYLLTLQRIYFDVYNQLMVNFIKPVCGNC